MINIKDLFSTPKSVIISSLCLFSITGIIGVGSAFAFSSHAVKSHIEETKVKNVAQNHEVVDIKPEETGDEYIGVDKAKAIAINHADVSRDTVSFMKAKLENDDGKVVYDIEFYFGDAEYEYEINALTGAIFDCESEAIDD